MIYQRVDEEYKSRKITIEGQLEKHGQHPDKSERSATLWHAWKQNKSWLIRLLELTLASFPAYSRHNASHAEAVLHNIERVLGEKRIQELSATDCFAILHTVYVHDIGMVILADDRQKIVKSDEFVDMVDELSSGADDDLKKAALQLKKKSYKKKFKGEIDLGGQEVYQEEQNLYEEKLETYYAIILLMAEYQRRVHGEKAATRVKDWIADVNKLRSEFAMSGIPMRIFFRIADCASLHTDWAFQHILDLPEEENGYDNDMLHPRFVAILLQIGDALDIDNDRFHPFAQAFLGKFPMQSQAHYDKHLAIRTLKITPEEIVIEADCANREAMRLVRNECDTLETLLKDASYHWSSIAPKGLSGALPAFKPPRLLMEGKAIPLDLAMMRFQISQKKAFSLLQGKNIYSGLFPFVRELLQNAIDSTKIQCYHDYVTSSKFRYKPNKEGIKAPSIMDISKIINPIEYPIEISINCGKVGKDGEWRKIEFDSISEKCEDDEEYGILFSIRDYGTGIDRETLRAISDVGTSYQRKKKLMREMPDWLRPTGAFGIGLQSVFLVTDKFYCETHVRNGERYGIEFRTGANGEKGHINVEPKSNENKPMAYGTEFRIFISHEKKKIRNEFMEAWPGYDPFKEGYEKEEIKRNITTLAAQILLDIDRQLENLLFPVYANIGFKMGDNYETQLKGKLSKIVFDNLGSNQNYTEEKLKENICWMYKCTEEKNNQNIKTFQMTNGMCMVDLEQMKINLWLEDISVSAGIGVERVIDSSLQKEKCKLYYKGILTEKQEVKNDSELLECIDIQGCRSSKSLLQLSRNGFTEEGQKYIYEVLVPKIFQALFEALKIIAEQEYANNEGERIGFAEVIKNNLELSLKKAIETDRKDQTWRRQVVGISLFYHFYMMERKKETLIYTSKKVQEESWQWEQALKNIRDIIDEKRSEMQRFGMLDVISQLQAYELESIQNDFLVTKKRNISMAEFFMRENKFAVVSKRRYSGDKWINYLLKLGRVENTEQKENCMDIIKAIEARVESDNDADKKEQYIEYWAELMLENVEGVMEKQSLQQSDFIQWMMKFVPVIGNFSDAEGNLRIHILSGKPLDSVYYNANAKYVLLKKIAKRTANTNAKRFAGYVWAGYEALRVDMVQQDVCYVTENYIYENKGVMLFPFHGGVVQQLVNLAEAEEEDVRINEGKGSENTTELQGQLIQIGERLDRYAYLRMEGCRETGLIDKFRSAFIQYCNRIQRPTSERAFWDALTYGYRETLKKAVKMALADKDDIGEKLPEISKIQALEKDIYEMLLDNEEYFAGGYQKETYLLNKVLELGKYYVVWRRQWERLLEKLIHNRINQIREKSWDSSLERKNMAQWIVEHNQYHIDLDTALECNDKLCESINEIVMKRWKENVSKTKRFRFLQLIF